MGKTARTIEEQMQAVVRAAKKRAYQRKEWWTSRSILGNTWAFFFVLLGSRERGKSYSVMKYCLTQFKLYGKPFTWLKLKESSMKKLLANNAAQLVDPDLYRKFDLDLTSKGNAVYNRGVKMCDVLALSTAYNDKGVAYFDNEWTLGNNIILDEFQLEKSERRTFDVSYNLVVQLENLVRSRKEKVRIFFIGNSTEETSDILSMFNFIPQDFGIYKLKKKKCVIDYMPNSEAYEERRKGTVGDILAGNTSNFTNKIETDVSHIYKGRLHKPQLIIKFTKDPADWFTVWDSNIVAKYNKERVSGMAMRRYIDAEFHPEHRDSIFELYDGRVFRYHSLITQKQFGYQLSLIKRQ